MYITGGFGSYLFGMSAVIAAQSENGNTPENIKDPSLKWMIPFLFAVSFIGLFSVAPLRRVWQSLWACSSLFFPFFPFFQLECGTRNRWTITMGHMCI